LTYLRPTLVKRVSPTQTDVTWNDGHFSSYPSGYLNCPCASCVEELTGRRKILEGSIPTNLQRLNVVPVGNYALNLKTIYDLRLTIDDCSLAPDAHEEMA
jgi:DUF971 family protein